MGDACSSTKVVAVLPFPVAQDRHFPGKGQEHMKRWLNYSSGRRKGSLTVIDRGRGRRGLEGRGRRGLEGRGRRGLEGGAAGPGQCRQRTSPYFAVRGRRKAHRDWRAGRVVVTLAFSIWEASGNAKVSGGETEGAGGWSDSVVSTAGVDRQSVEPTSRRAATRLNFSRLSRFLRLLLHGRRVESIGY